jgi:hypothetical protein
MDWESIGVISEMSQYVSVKNFEEDKVEFIIQVKNESVDDRQVMDRGLLLSLIDTYTSLSNVLFKIYKDGISLSVALKMTSFEELKYNNDYLMKVFLPYEANNLTFFEFEIYNKDNTLVSKGSHMKKVKNIPKF